MEIRILGPLEVSSAADSVDVPSGKEGLLLAALAVHANHVVSTDRLFEFLWRGERTVAADFVIKLDAVRLHRRHVDPPERSLLVDGAEAGPLTQRAPRTGHTSDRDVRFRPFQYAVTAFPEVRLPHGRTSVDDPLLVACSQQNVGLCHSTGGVADTYAAP